MDKQKRKNNQSSNKNNDKISNSCNGCRKKQQMSNQLNQRIAQENTDEFCN